jgi:hypothetical protein
VYPLTAGKLQDWVVMAMVEVAEFVDKALAVIESRARFAAVMCRVFSATIAPSLVATA